MIILPAKHKDPTIAFRPSPWERTLIDERALLSGLHKPDVKGSTDLDDYDYGDEDPEYDAAEDSFEAGDDE